MHFSYDGFTHHGNRRCFQFRGIEERNPVRAFSIEIDLPLFAQNRVPIQEGPMFCLQMLTAAMLAGPPSLDRLRSYRVVGDDFRPLLIEREKHAAEKALRLRARRFGRTPPYTSNVHLGMPSRSY
jgi:hypothetical protein